MPLTHLFLALLVVFVWGMNFLFVSFGLDEMSPMLLCALRFFLASVPAIFFVKLPSASLRIVALYGLVTFALQFAFLFLGMSIGMPAGTASILMQVQVFFSMFFAGLFLGEQPNIGQLIGALVSFMGIGVVAMHIDSDVSLAGFICILAAAASWGFGNLITKRIKTQGNNMMALIVWGSFFACIPMFFAVLMTDGMAHTIDTVQHISWKGIGSLFYIVFASTWVGYGVWNWLIARYPVGMVVPFTLLVPVVAMLSSVLVLGEPFYLWKLVAGLLVISGLCINILGSRIIASREVAI